MAYLRQASSSIASCLSISTSVWVFILPSLDGNQVFEFGDSNNVTSTIQLGSDGIVQQRYWGGIYLDRIDGVSYNTQTLTQHTAVGALPVGSWAHLACSIKCTDVQFAYGTVSGTIVINAVSKGNTAGVSVGGSSPPAVGSGGILVNGYEFGIPYNTFTVNNSPFSTVIRMADLQIWFNKYIDWTDSTNYSKVVTISGTTGTPASTSTAASAFGTQTILLKGNATAFSTNRGTGGSFSKIGTISNYTPTPSF